MTSPEQDTRDPLAALEEIRAFGYLPDKNGAAAFTQSDQAARDIPRLLAGYDALLKAHQPGRHVIAGETCKRHEAHRHFSIDSNEAAGVRSCPDCSATVYRACTGCDPVSVDRCHVRTLIAAALSGSETPS